MKLEFEPYHALPRLAWRAVVRPAEGICRVQHGPWVETSAHAFVEGVWDGAFAGWALCESAYVFGSGGSVDDDAFTFVSSASTTDPLYWVQDGEQFHVSNSLPLLLAGLDDALDPACAEYDIINQSIALGTARYRRDIPTRRGAVSRLLHRNLVITRDGATERDKRADPRFARYDDYYAFLASTYAKLAENARSQNRKRPMTVFSTQSKGYDSTAMNAIAAKHGLEKVFTVSRGKAKGYFGDEDRGLETDDDGSDICALLGMPCVSIDRRATERDATGEPLVYATMHESSDLNLHQVAAHVERPTVLLTGCLGELWYTAGYYRDRPGYINPNYVRADLGNHGMTETRLVAGYVQLAVPYIGAGSREDIFRITLSDEMAPWRLDVAYDRPIPRRIAEEAGVPRNMFGQTKMASVFELPPPLVPMDVSLRREYFAFLERERVRPRWSLSLLPLVRRWNAIVITTSPSRHRWNYYLQRAISKVTRRSFAFKPVWTALNGRIFCFGVNRRIRVYRDALRGEHGAVDRRQ